MPCSRSCVLVNLTNSLTISSYHLPLATISSFSKSLSLFLKILHLSNIIQSFSFSVLFTSLSMTISRSIHEAESGIISSFQRLSKILLYILTISSSILLLMDISVASMS